MYRELEPTDPPPGRPFQDVLLDLLHSDPEAFMAAHGEKAVGILKAIVKLCESRGATGSANLNTPPDASFPPRRY